MSYRRVPTLRNEQSAESAQGTTARHGSGTRQRRFATQLAKRYDHVVGLDNSSTMLRTTAQSIADQPAKTQIELVQRIF
ncbi:MAG: hypothetical protein CM15mP120_14520 [Pseudomonadota bacterium]|nr:MAG: hypothetical protein CM15mP120_14520 [Pseudomonadota bacterium]